MPTLPRFLAEGRVAPTSGPVSTNDWKRRFRGASEPDPGVPANIQDFCSSQASKVPGHCELSDPVSRLVRHWHHRRLDQAKKHGPCSADQRPQALELQDPLYVAELRKDGPLRGKVKSSRKELGGKECRLRGLVSGSRDLANSWVVCCRPRVSIRRDCSY